MTAPVSFIRPLTITAGMIAESTAVNRSVTEPDWNATVAYTAGQVVYRPALKRRFECLIDGTDASPPEDALDRWYDLGATDKTTMFDNEVSTPSIADGTLTQVFQPGAFNAAHLLGLDGRVMQFKVEDISSGTSVIDQTIQLEDSEPPDYYEHFFESFRPKTEYLVTGLEPYVNCKVTISISNPGGIARCGMASLGDLVSVGGPALSGVTVEPKSYSRIETDSRGKTSIRKGKAAKDLSASALVPLDNADAVVDAMTSVLGVPCTWIITDSLRMRSMRAFGLGSGKLTYGTSSNATLNLTVQGMI